MDKIPAALHNEMTATLSTDEWDYIGNLINANAQNASRILAQSQNIVSKLNSQFAGQQAAPTEGETNG